jgi:hypothetical protein
MRLRDQPQGSINDKGLNLSPGDPINTCKYSPSIIDTNCFAFDEFTNDPSSLFGSNQLDWMHMDPGMYSQWPVEANSASGQCTHESTAQRVQIAKPSILHPPLMYYIG